MNNRQRKTLQRIFSDESGNNIRWSDDESMLRGLDAELEEGSGSRVTVTLGELSAVFHRLHPQPTIRRGVVVALRRFLESAGVDP